MGEQAAAFIRGMIMSGRLRGGEFVRLERMVEELGISATPVREALLALRGEGFVQLVPRRGFVVVPLTREDIRDLFLVQADLAGELAARAARKMTPALVEQIERLQQELEEAARGGDPEAIEVANHRFHRAINLTAESPKLGWFLTIAVRYAPRHFYASIHGWQEASVADHHAIVDAMRSKSASKARTAMRKHVLHAGELLVGHLEETGFWAE
ncbi:GntR family transcriptional regulator [Nocardioides sp. KR10-350]|uniref:GntR family transcriptional regulator n=1 Tax=Nocardioides cheoyonin TaxID=3156615 RepID=UPI0032B469C3